MARVGPTTACFAATYGATPGRATRPMPEALTDPALLNAPSRRPNSESAAATRAESASTETSEGTKNARPPPWGCGTAEAAAGGYRTWHCLA
ncbi:hypothetical protein AMK22_34870 [Streptomyces sp. CB01580]|nr:hypothetical protein AMK22_34870 [Streptomyces sp. CB01580]